jgi:hypothetical protein
VIRDSLVIADFRSLIGFFVSTANHERNHQSQIHDQQKIENPDRNRQIPNQQSPTNHRSEITKSTMQSAQMFN